MIRKMLLCAFCVSGTCVHADVSVQRVSYHGWAGCYRISNEFVELVYVPQIGRTMRFAKIGGPNILWENPRLAGKDSHSIKPGEWVNYGGDKLWPAPQSRWNWPPDPILDGSPYNVSIAGKFLQITGAASQKSGVRFTRLISLDPTGLDVHIENRMTNTSSQVLAVWEIAQTDNPDQILVPLEISKEMPNGWAPFEDHPFDPAFGSIRDDVLVVRRNPHAGSKLGTGSAKGILTIKRGGLEFSFSAKKAPGAYADGGRFLQVFTSGDPDKYVELEILGPLTKLKPGQTATLKTTWSLRK